MTGDSATMTGAPGRMTGTPDPLQGALERLRLEGAIFLRAEYTEGWAYESPPGADLAALLRPGAERLIFFHIVAKGRCWISLPDGDPMWAEEGDVIVIPYGDQHAMGGSSPCERVPIASLLDPPPWNTMPVIRHGAGGDETHVVCGYLHSEDPLFDPALQTFPPAFVVRPPPGPAAQWVDASIRYAVSLSTTGPPPTRLPELLLVEVLRLHLATAPAATHGWLAALHDPVLAPAMALVHREPERRWTVADLAAEVAVSRSLLDERFRRVLGRSPIRYLAEWRMHLAADLLRTTDLGVTAVARRVGYEAEEAFSRAFKRHHGVAPGTWRNRR